MWQKIVDQELPLSTMLKLSPFIDSLKGEFESAILPRAFQDGSVAWYILPPSARVGRFSREEIRAFLGNSYSLSDGPHTRLDPADQIDQEVLAKFGKNAFKIYVPAPLRDMARERFLTYLQLRSARPARLSSYARSSSRVLRDFEYAILAGACEEAMERIEELRGGGHLDATNLLFLRVRALAAGHQWGQIYALPEMESLLNIQRPIRVTECLIRSVYITQLQKYEDESSQKEAVTRFGQLYETFQDLYKTRSKLKGAEIEASFLLAALVAEPPRSDVAQAILGTADAISPHGMYLSALAGLLPPTQTIRVDSLTEARQAFANGDIDKALEHAHISPSSNERSILLLRCAWEAGTLSAARIALDSLQALEEADNARLHSSGPTAKLISSLEALSSGVETDGSPETEVLTGWLPWLERLNENKPWDRALAVAEVGSREWDPSELAMNFSAIGLLNDALLADKPEWSKTVFRNAVPFLVDFFTANGSDNRFLSVYDTLFLLVAMDEQMSASQTQILARLGDIRLSLGVSLSTYLDCVSQLKGTLESMNSPAVVDSFLDVCESLMSHPCPSPESRIGVFVATAASLARWHRRLNASQVALFRNLCGELGHNLIASEIPTAEETDTSGGFTVELAHRRLGIYSLQEGSARRAALLIRQMVPSVRVEVFSDHVGGSAALKNAAQQFDLFVVVTAAAKHAATIFIESKRPKDKPTLYANGQGSSSIFQTLNSYFEGASN